MTHETLEKLLNELDAESTRTLIEKNRKYSDPADALHNFAAGGEILGGTAAQACWGYLAKHLTALRDKVERNDFDDIDDVKEKCQDSINYIRFLWCIANEERVNSVAMKVETPAKQFGDMPSYVALNEWRERNGSTPWEGPV